MLDGLRQDLKQGARTLVHNPGFALVAILSIAIGIGANAAMYSVADTLVLRPLPVPRASEVVRVMAETTRLGFQSPTASAISYPDYVDIRDRARSFESLAAYRLIVAGFTDRADQQAQRRFGLAVSANLFESLGVRPALGRSFRRDDDRVGGSGVVLLDYDAWAQEFGADPAVVGRRVRVGSADMAIIGVMPSGFTGPDQLVRPSFYVPLATLPALASGTPRDELTRRDLRNLEVKGRLKPGVSIRQAAEEVKLIAAGLEQSLPATNRNQGLTVRSELDARLTSRPTLGVLAAMLMTLALLVLVVACANVAGLLASRAPVRARELALRTALGAPRLRVVRQLIVEGLLLATVGGIAGVVVGAGVIAAFRSIELTTDVPLNLTFEINRRVALVGMTLALVSGLLASLLPAWRSARLDVIVGIRGRAQSARQPRLWGRHLLVCSQVALSLVLLTVAVFLYRSYHAEIGRGPGFQTDRILMMTFYPDLVDYDQPRTDRFYQQLTDTMKGLPGVRSVALTSTVPMDPNSVENTLVAPEGFSIPAGSRNVRVLSSRVDEGYFETLDIRIVNGRALRRTDTASTPRVAVVNETFASHYWPAQNAVGKRFRLNDAAGQPVEIVGVAADAKYRALSEAPTEFVYFPRLQNGATNRGTSTEGTLLVATVGDAAALTSPLRNAVRRLDATMPVFDVRTMEAFYRVNTLGLSNVIIRTVGVMGAIGLLLAMIGLYGLVAYSVSSRTREIGIRIAVGARPGAVLRMVLTRALLLASAGSAVGLLASVPTSGLLRAAFPFPSVTGGDLVTYAIVVPLLVMVTLLAAYMPARRAARIDPLVAVRQD